MTDLEKIQYTKNFIDKLAKGINPLTGEAIPEKELLNNIRVSRCLFYVSSILQEMCYELTSNRINNKTKRNSKSQFHITDNQLEAFAYSTHGMYIGDIVFQLNTLIDTDGMRKINYKQITNWLISQEYLYVFTMDNGLKCKRPTRAGLDLGIREELRHGNKGDYYVLIYNENAQKFVVSSCNSINGEQSNFDETSLRGQRWTSEQDEMLKSMFSDGILVSEITQKLQRTEGAIRARLVRLGLINDRSEAL